MKRLYVLFDGECALCARCRTWLERQPAYVELIFIPLQSPEVPKRFPGIDRFDLRAELVVVSDDGAVYQGPAAWIMCLHSLRDYRAWAQRLSHPTLLPLARRVCQLVSENRLATPRWLLNAKPETALARLEAMPEPSCEEGNCHV